MPVTVLNLVRDRVEIRVVRPRLDEQNRVVRVFRQSRRENGPGRARADDDRVVCIGDFGRTLGGVTCWGLYADLQCHRAFHFILRN